MIRVIIHGAKGKMGRKVADLSSADPDVVIAAGIDAAALLSGTEEAEEIAGVPIYPDFASCPAEADVVIDFSTAGAVDALLDDCVKAGMPLVLCTTGLSEKQLEKVKEASEKIPVLRSANMSIGVNLIEKVLADIVPLLYGAGFDVEIIEKHHNQKTDAPSGTALAMADVVREAAGEEVSYVFDRSGVHERRQHDQIGISAVRGGTIVGEHEILFAGEDEVISLEHKAYSRAVFAKGALEAAKFIAGREPGLYGMNDLISGRQ